MSKDSAHLADILAAAKAVRRFVSGVTKEQFLVNEEKYEAVNRKFEIMGEAARRLSPGTRQQFPDVPWQLISAMRNILIHDYDDVDLNVVWDTVHDDLPPLMAKIETYLATQPPDESGI
ncbi:MAG: DUF86 domain-containing protein [Verrucomicrobia bacterium]|nr:DUF86 domain-containing protein [Verrucomicrobiota bacterium]